MIRHRASKGLEFLMIPLFFMTSCGDNNIRSDIVTIDNGHKYFVSFNKETNQFKATRDISTSDSIHFYQLIGVQERNCADMVISGTDIRSLTPYDKAESEMIYSSDRVKRVLDKE